MKQKGVYSYDNRDSFEKFEETQLPLKEEFHWQLILTGEQITDEEYEHAQKNNVWKTLKSKNMGEYHNLYLQSDALLLADVFENFRKTCLQYYKLQIWIKLIYKLWKQLSKNHRHEKSNQTYCHEIIMIK